MVGLTSMLTQTTDFFPPPQIPDFDKLILTTCRKPFTPGRSSDSFDTSQMRWEDEYRLQGRFAATYRVSALDTVQQLLV